MQFDHPSKQAIETFMKIQQRKNNPTEYSSCFGELTAFSAYYFLIYGAFFAVVNPYGRASRMKYEQKFNPVWRHARKLMPFGILFSGLAYADMQTGIL